MGFPGLLSASPIPFSFLECFVGIRSATGVRLFKNNFGLYKMSVRLFVGLISSFRRRQCHRLESSLPLSCAKFSQFLYYTSLVSLCGGQVKLSLDIMFYSKFYIIIFKALLTKPFFWSLQKLPHNHMARGLLKITLASAISLQGKDLTILCCLK